jgi:RHS repeat-associated protein
MGALYAMERSRFRKNVTQVMVDENGATVANYSYDPWGKVLSVSEHAAVAGQPIGYAGYYYDKETKLHYLEGRHYDPETARFVSRDPYPGDIDNPITQNGYTYANNNPVMMVDPTGNIAQAIVMRVARTIISFAAPLLKRFGQKAVPAIVSKAKKLLSKFQKHYIITFNDGNSIIKIRKRNGKKKKKDVWHYHLGDPNIHYVFGWSLEKGWRPRDTGKSKYIIVW